MSSKSDGEVEGIAREGKHQRGRHLLHTLERKIEIWGWHWGDTVPSPEATGNVMSDEKSQFSVSRGGRWNVQSRNWGCGILCLWFYRCSREHSGEIWGEESVGVGFQSMVGISEVKMWDKKVFTAPNFPTKCSQLSLVSEESREGSCLSKGVSSCWSETILLRTLDTNNQAAPGTFAALISSN